MLKYADLTYSEDEHSVLADKTVVPLTKTEMSVLAFMMNEPQKPILATVCWTRFGDLARTPKRAP